MGGICPVGHYCPTGTTTPIPCGAGAFSNVTGLSTCHQCPAGYYCLLGADNYQATPVTQATTVQRAPPQPLSTLAQRAPSTI